MKNLRFVFILFFAIIFIYSCNPKNPSITNAEVQSTANKKTLVLAIDGGGIKGIIPAYFLTLVEAGLNNTKSYQLFDVIGGTSTGGIISIGLTTPDANNSDKSPRTAAQLLDFYMKDCGSIFFKNNQTEDYFPYGPSYYADSVGHGIEPFLREKLTANLTLADAERMLPVKKVKQVFTTSLLINSTGGPITNGPPVMGTDYGPYLFNWADAIQHPEQNYLLWEAARSTSAAPTYFPVANVGGGKNGRSAAAEKWAVDGGVMSNDPAVWAITESLRTGIAKSIDDLVVISLGCGLDRYNGGIAVTNEQANTKIGQKYGFWGTSTWTLPAQLDNLNNQLIEDPAILESAVYANQFVPSSQLNLLKHFTGMEYFRVQPELPVSLLAMDDCSNVNALKSFAQHYFMNTAEGKKMVIDVVNVIKANL